jgi:hypothetical protein
MIIYYNFDNDICISFSGDMFAEPDMKITVLPDVVIVNAGDVEQEFERGMYISAVQEGDKIIIDFDASTPETDGIEMEVAIDAESVVIAEGGEPVAEVTPDGTKDKEDMADEEAAKEGKKCKVGEEYFDTLKDAFVSAQPNVPLTIKMIADETGAGLGLFATEGDTNKDITIDFDGHKYIASSPAVGSKGTQTQALHLEMGNKVTLKNGEFTSDRNAADIKMLIQNYCDLTLDNMVCDCADDASITYVCSNNFGNCLIKNSKLLAHPSRVALDCWFGLGKTYDDGLTVTAQNSVIDSKIEYGAQKAALSREGNETWWEKAVLTLDGCTFGSIVNSGQASEADHHSIYVDGEEVGFTE